MLAVLGDYLKSLGSEIESYEQLIAQKREEAQKLTQLQGEVVEALGLLKGIVDELRIVDPAAIATIQTAALQIFDNGRKSQSGLSTLNNNSSEPNAQIFALDADNPLEVATIANKNGSERQLRKKRWRESM
jgi:predicted TIM-barrel fold metal-dependent hydrolase